MSGQIRSDDGWITIDCDLRTITIVDPPPCRKVN